MMKNVTNVHEDATYSRRDMSPSLKGLLMDKGHGRFKEAIRETEMDIEAVETMMEKLVHEYNTELWEDEPPYIKLYVRNEKRSKTGARPRTFLLWLARSGLCKATNGKIKISTLVDPIETHKVMGESVVRVLKSNEAAYQKMIAYDFIRHKINAVYALHYDKYRRLRELKATVSHYQQDAVDATMKKMAREVNQQYFNVEGLETLFEL